MRYAHRLGVAAVVWLCLISPGMPGCTSDTDKAAFDNPLDPTEGASLAVPESLRAVVGDNAVRLAWRLPAGEEADEYAVFRHRVDTEIAEEERLVDRVTDPSYSDARVQNGRTYAYRIAAGVGGRFGNRSEEIEATPGLFAVLIADDAGITGTRSVSVRASGPNAIAVSLSENPQGFTPSWHDVTSPIVWTLSPGDGMKTVYARFRTEDGSESLPVFDQIRLDTRASIESVSFTGPNLRRPGEVVHFRLVAGEAYGAATITVSGVFEAIPLYDDGTGGDTSAEDGTYERSLTIPVTAAALNERVLGDFTDQAGNVATSLQCPVLLSIPQELEPVILLEPTVSHPPDAPTVTLRWDAPRTGTYAAYRVFRAETATVDSTARLLETITTPDSHQIIDLNVIEGRTYWYRVYAQDRLGTEVGSNTVPVAIPNQRPPAAVTLEVPTAASTSRIAVAWTRATDADFGRYRLFRNLAGAVSDGDDLVAEVDSIDQTFWDDAGLQENTRYYYRVYTVDQGGLAARSNEVEARTRNEAPAAVDLDAPFAGDSTAVSLSWHESSVHDFAYYRLYRDVVATVTTGSTLVVELDQPSFTGFRDAGLESSTQYYYRVFVVDDGEEARATGSNTVTYTTP